MYFGAFERPKCSIGSIQRSPTLHQYMIFVDTVRKYQEQMKFDMAIEKTVDECIRNRNFGRFSEAEQSGGVKDEYF